MIYLMLRLLSPLLYLVAVIFYWRYFDKKNGTDKRLARVFDNAGLLIHFSFLIMIGAKSGILPLADAFQALSSFLFFFALINKTIIRQREYSLGVFYSAIMFLFQTVAMIFIRIDAPVPEILLNFSFEIHVIFNLFGYAAFAVAFLSAVKYILLFHEIKGQRWIYFYDRLPSLGYMENLIFRTMLIGFLFNTLGIILGAFTGKSAWGIYWSWDPKLIAVLLAWLIYAIALLGRSYRHWTGNRLAYLSCIGFSWIIFSMLIINQFFSKIHSFK